MTSYIIYLELCTKNYARKADNMKLKRIVVICAVSILALLYVGYQKAPTLEEATAQSKKTFTDEFTGAITIDEGKKQLSDLNKRFKDSKFKSECDLKQIELELKRSYLTKVAEDITNTYLEGLLRKGKHADIDEIVLDNSKRLIEPDFMVMKSKMTTSWLTAFKKEDGIRELNDFKKRLC